MSPEAGLALLIVALYLLDSLLLLRPDEAVLVCSQRWHAGFGTRGYKLAGREPWLANPWLPHRPVFRLRWRVAQPSTDPLPVSDLPRDPGDVSHAEFEPRLRRLRQLAPAACVSWLLLVVLIPCTLLWPLLTSGIFATLAAAALLYVNIALALALVWRWRDDLGLSGRAFALLAFECLVCAPYSANLVRRLSWHARIDEDFAEAAARLLEPPALIEVRRECLARIDEWLEAEPEGGTAATDLRAARARLAAQIDAAAGESGARD